jgi:hypothetical protein
MVEASKAYEFGDHAGFRQDAEMLAALDKQRNGMTPSPHRLLSYRLLVYREDCLYRKGD